MAEIKFSPEAIADLQQTKVYIAEELYWLEDCEKIVFYRMEQ